jgi:hypothetical protein
MPVLLASLLTGVSSVIVQMIIKVVANPDFIRKVMIMSAEKLVKLTPTDADDKILELAKQVLEHDAVEKEQA